MAIFDWEWGQEKGRKFPLIKAGWSALFWFVFSHDEADNSFLDSDDYCCLLITFENILNPDQDSQNISPDMDPNWLTLR